MKSNSILQAAGISVFALASLVSVATSSAALNFFVKIQGAKGPAIEVQVNDDGTFQTPKLSEDTYTITVVHKGINSPNLLTKTSETASEVPSDATPQTILFYYEVKSPRDMASGQASGKRQHSAITITKEWGRSTTQQRMDPVVVDMDCDGLTGKIEFKNAKGVKIPPHMWDLAKGKGY